MALVLIDRDGVLNEDRPDAVKTPDELRMIPRAAEAVARLNAARIHVALTTNQSVVGRGIIEQAMLEHIHAKLHGELARAGARLDAVFVAPDAPTGASDRRKPGPGMLREALSRFGAAPCDTPMIGDGMSDLKAAAAAGCPRVLVRTGKGAATQAVGLSAELLPVAVYEDLWAAVDALLSARAGIGV
ncbi:MAG TPA: HAD-IIIA family hydrolase [Alphaproteobacteria bacterium]|nr:HAD-IIIA family hydrolase [Alphaproteobacteria bacterium]